MIRGRPPIDRSPPAPTTLRAAMGARIRKRLPAAIVLAAVGSCLAAALAFGIIIVYSNNFSSAGSKHQLSLIEGKHCEKAVAGGSLRVKVRQGPERCGYALPVEGEARQPDQDLQATMKVLRKTAKHSRRHAYVALDVRAGAGSHYELRVFPKGKTFVLKRTPPGPGFPVTGKDHAINPIDELNTLRLQAFGHVVRAWVNGSKLAAVSDSKPKDVGGRRAELVVANAKHRSTPKDVFARVTGVRLSVPKP
jgi:hypothetical protein